MFLKISVFGKFPRSTPPSKLGFRRKKNDPESQFSERKFCLELNTVKLTLKTDHRTKPSRNFFEPKIMSGK